MNTDAAQVDLTALRTAFARFRAALPLLSDDLRRDGAIQRFEYVLELGWETVKRVLSVRGLDVASLKETFRLAARESLIADPSPWFRFVELRNQASHTYREAVAAEIAEAFLDFEREVAQLLVVLERCDECAG